MALVAVTFNDVVNITPGDDEEYSRVLVALGINSGVNSWPRNFLTTAMFQAQPSRSYTTRTRTAS